MKSAPPAAISLVFNMPVEIATAARFLASDDAKWVSCEARFPHRSALDLKKSMGSRLS